jgi:hypothetical protein
MSDIFDKLNIDLKNFKDEKKLHKELYDKICTEQSVLTRKYFEENLSSDFEKLSEIYKNYKKKLSVDFYKKNKELSIRLFDYFNSEVTEMKISLFFTSDYPNKDEKLEKFKKYEISDDKMYLSVTWDSKEYFVVSDFMKNEKRFKLREKEKAYEYFNDLFKSKILIKKD